MNADTTDSVKAYYASSPDKEWLRLDAAREGCVEFAVTCRALVAHLPQPARVLDIGGGPGRYSIWLAQRGHRVVLADLSPELLTTARANVEQAGVAAMVEEIVEADARDLSRWADGSFDAVLALGPFYHLQDARERRQAAREMARVLRPGGVAFAAMVTRYSLLRRTLLHPDERHRLADRRFLSGLLGQGIYDNEMAGRFTGAYAVRADEVVPFFAAQGFAGVALLSCESIAVNLQPTLVQLAGESEAAYQAVMDAVADAASDPSILGLAGHLLYVGRKPG